MDNETSGEFIRPLKDKRGSIPIGTTAHTYRRNLAERAIQTWKNDFKAGLASDDPKFPLSEWERLIHQANITLNFYAHYTSTQTYQRIHTFLGNSTLQVHH